MKALLIVPLLIAAGCSSAPKYQVEKSQYCYTNQDIQVQNNEAVSSVTRIECTDDKTRQLFQARSGIARDCVEFSFPMYIRGQLIERTAYACQKFSGTYEIFNPGIYR